MTDMIGTKNVLVFKTLVFVFLTIKPRYYSPRYSFFSLSLKLEPRRTIMFQRTVA